MVSEAVQPLLYLLQNDQLLLQVQLLLHVPVTGKASLLPVLFQM